MTTKPDVIEEIARVLYLWPLPPFDEWKALILQLVEKTARVAAEETLRAQRTEGRPPDLRDQILALLKTTGYPQYLNTREWVAFHEALTRIIE